MTVSLDSDPSTPVTLASILSSVHITTQMRTKDSDLVVTWFLIGNWFYHFRKKYQSQLNLLLTLRKQPCAVCDSNLGMIHVKPLDSEAFAGRKHQGHLWWGWPSTAAEPQRCWTNTCFRWQKANKQTNTWSAPLCKSALCGGGFNVDNIRKLNWTNTILSKVQPVIISCLRMWQFIKRIWKAKRFTCHLHEHTDSKMT